MSNNSSCQSLSPTVYLSGYSIILTLGLFLNITALWFFIVRLPSLRSPTKVYMKNLAFADFLLVCMLPLMIYQHAAPLGTDFENIRTLCIVAGTFLLLNMYGSIFLLACISLDRCLALCFPLRSRSFRRFAPWFCAGVWMLNLGACATLFFRHTSNSTDSTNECFSSHPPVVTMRAPTIASLLIGFLVPLGIMVVSSCSLLRAVSKSQSAQDGTVNRRKLIHMLSANLAIFLFCFLPYHAVLLSYQIWERNCILQEAYKIALLMACSNTVLDPIAYYFATETMQKKIVEEKIRLAGGSGGETEKNSNVNLLARHKGTQA
ncbi:hypothetical protein XENTR_v10010198 [Xenopus tropicalis]|uniref:Lysophosphatidic acid receptor 4 n=1 Tax=Xenopus tropicalis TaxID=8364 RepID=A0A1B8Y901_XENTR|nr:lysophosphatidic acid receptor 4 [Xenopus tropicalis]KAE8620339.1 hypothetical protein XENTR_v10010198 [Xenopus tropicalis]|eukprot:XP_017944956.1 PREDICTED: lysophosphatidic acid receptor 4-like [Xenopus tropicalis]